MNSYEFSESATEMHAQADADWWKDLSDATIAAEIADFQDMLDKSFEPA